MINTSTEFTALELNLPALPTHIEQSVLEDALESNLETYNPCDKDTPVPSYVKYIENITPEQEKAIHDDYMRRELKMQEKTVKSLHLPRFPLEGEPLDWVKNNISSEYLACNVGVTTTSEHSETLGPHIGLTRAFALMYLLTLGGDVKTRFYHMKGEPRRYGLCRTVPRDYSQLDLIESHSFSTGKWYILNEAILHDVHGIRKPRVSVQLSLGKVLPDHILQQIPESQRCVWE